MSSQSRGVNRCARAGFACDLLRRASLLPRLRTMSEVSDIIGLTHWGLGAGKKPIHYHCECGWQMHQRPWGLLLRQCTCMQIDTEHGGMSVAPVAKQKM